MFFIIVEMIGICIIIGKNLQKMAGFFSIAMR